LSNGISNINYEDLVDFARLMKAFSKEIQKENCITKHSFTLMFKKLALQILEEKLNDME
jgi:hypothetical protein